MLQILQGETGLHIAFDHVLLFLPNVQLEAEVVYARCEPCFLV
jgi:hypothetical protein